MRWLLGPKRRDRRSLDPAIELECVWAGVEDDAGEETLAEAVAQPGQMSRIACGWGCPRLYLEADDALAAKLGQEVDLLATALGAQVVEAGPGAGDLSLGPELSGDEGVEEPPEDAAIACT